MSEKRGVAVEVGPGFWRWGCIDEDDAFHEVLRVETPCITAEVLVRDGQIAFVADGWLTDEKIDAIIAALLGLRSDAGDPVPTKGQVGQ